MKKKRKEFNKVLYQKMQTVLSRILVFTDCHLGDLSLRGQDMARGDSMRNSAHDRYGINIRVLEIYSVYSFSLNLH
jgi:hypothetical protein